MRARDALKLHNHDQVTLKANGETVEVISTCLFLRRIYITVMSKEFGYMNVTHTDVK